MQEILLTIHLKRGTWDRSRANGPSVSAITRNKIIDALRRRGRQIHVPLEEVVDSLKAEDEQPDIFPHDIDLLLGKLTHEQRGNRQIDLDQGHQYSRDR